MILSAAGITSGRIKHELPEHNCLIRFASTQLCVVGTTYLKSIGKIHFRQHNILLIHFIYLDRISNMIIAIKVRFPFFGRLLALSINV